MSKSKKQKKATKEKPQKKKPPKESTAEKNMITVLLKKHRDKNGGHHHVILEDIGNKHVSVGLTKSKTKGKNSTRKLYTCDNDVIGNNKCERSKMQRQGTVDLKRNYHPKETHGSMTDKDYKQAKIYGERAKQKYFDKEKK